MSRNAIVILTTMFGAVLVAAPLLISTDENPVIASPLPPEALQQVMEGIYQAQDIDVPDRDIPGVIVPHHLTASEGIARGIRMLSKKQPQTVLLVSPDHFNKCPTVVCTTRGTFTTMLGDVETDDALIDAIARSTLVTIDAPLFSGEHGIAAVLPFIKHALPDATIVPVVLSDGWFEHKEELVKLLQGIFDQTGTMIVSSDFSHYLPLKKADEMDEITAEALFAKDLAGIVALKNPEQSDCPVCLWSFATIAANNDFYNPSVLVHSNSARILQEETIPETTSHFSMAWYRNDDLTGDDLAVAGDVTMTRRITTPKLKPGMQEFWKGKGMRFVNLEGPVLSTCAPDRAMFDFCNAEHLWKGMLGLATHWAVLNNHTFDQYTEGLDETKRIIDTAGETWVGDSFVDAGSVRLISLTALMNPVADAGALDIGASYRHVIDQLKHNPSDKLTVVLTHAGKEYVALGSETYNQYLRSFIDAGADVVVAVHTHVISDMEMYKGKPIFRGVGNFIFDQFEDVATSTAMAVRLRKEGDQIMFETLRTKE